MIFDGAKTVETRSRPTLDRYCGMTVGVIRTGRGKNMLVGTLELCADGAVNEAEFRQMFDSHRVPSGSCYDIKPGGVKYLYRIKNAVRMVEPVAVATGCVLRRFGRVACDVDINMVSEK